MNNIEERTSCGRRDMMIAATENKDGVFSTFVILCLVVWALAIAASVYEVAHPATDSQGVPCTISTAQHADGSLECK